MHRSTPLRRFSTRASKIRHSYSRPLRKEALEDRRLLAIDVAFDDGLLAVASDADDEIHVRASGDATQIFGSDTTVSKVPTEDITRLNIQTGDSTSTIDITEVTAQNFPNIEQAVFEGGPWVDVETTKQIIEETLGPSWDQNLGIADSDEYLETGAWKVPLADGSLATQLTEAGWGNAQGLLDQIISEVDRRALVRSFSFGSAEAAPTFGRLFNGHYDNLLASENTSGANAGLSSSAAAAALIEITSAASADLNGDGIVGAPDYTMWANAAGSAADDLVADLNGDGLVDVADYDRMLEQWGTGGDAHQELSAFLDGGEGGGGPAQVLISDPVVDEADGTATFAVSLSRSDSTEIRVDWTTAWDTAFSPDDFTGDTGTVVFSPGDTLELVTVAISDDAWDEATETFTVDLSNAVNAALLETQGIGTILDNDAEPTISISDVTVDEASGEAVFTVSLSTISHNTITVDWSTADGSATSPADYSGSPSQTINFWPTLTDVEITVPIANDSIVESIESFVVDLSNAVGATIADAQSVATITDNDPEPFVPDISIDDVTVKEGDGNATLTVTLSQSTTTEVRVDWETFDGSAISDGLNPDFDADSGQVVFAPNETSQQIQLDINYDNLFDEDEVFFVVLSNPIAATIADDEGTVTITDFSQLFSINDISVNEGNFGESTYEMIISLSSPNDAAVGVSYKTLDVSGTAEEDLDYTPLDDDVIFEPGETEQTISVEILGDLDSENDEYFSVYLYSPVGGLVADRHGLVTIFDDDGPGGGLPDFTLEIDTDSDNDGSITASDDSIEADPAYPGRLIVIDEEHPENLDLAHAELSFDPGSLSPGDLTEYEITLTAGLFQDDSVLIWDSPTQDELIPINSLWGRTWPADQFPSTMDVYVEAVDHGHPITLTLTVARQFPVPETGGVALAYLQQDEVQLRPIRGHLLAYRPETRFLSRSSITSLHEETIGAGIRRNLDDDNDNNVPDWDEYAVAGESDLVELIAWSTPGGTYDVILTRTSNDLAVWQSNGKFDGPDPILGRHLETDQERDEENLNTRIPNDIRYNLWVEWVGTDPNVTESFIELYAEDHQSGARVLLDRVRFYPFNSVVIGFVGEFAQPDDAENGVRQMISRLREAGYDAQIFDEGDGADPPGAGGPTDALAELLDAVRYRIATEAAIFGHSHGGGTTYDVANDFSSEPGFGTTFQLAYTAYIDAVQQPLVSTVPEWRRPTGTVYHTNIYQPVDSPFRGTSMNDVVAGSADEEFNAVADLAQIVTHSSIDNNTLVQDHIVTTTQIRVSTR